MRILKIRYADGKEFLADYRPDVGAGGGIFYRTRSMDPGERMLAKVTVGEDHVQVLKTKVVAGEEDDPPGVVLEIDEEDFPKRDLLLNAAQNDA